MQFAATGSKVTATVAMIARFNMAENMVESATKAVITLARINRQVLLVYFHYSEEMHHARTSAPTVGNLAT